MEQRVWQAGALVALLSGEAGAEGEGAALGGAVPDGPCPASHARGPIGAARGGARPDTAWWQASTGAAHGGGDEGAGGPDQTGQDSVDTADESPNGDTDPLNDDTDGDGTPNYLDSDDDNDENDAKKGKTNDVLTGVIKGKPVVCIAFENMHMSVGKPTRFDLV